MRDTLYFYNFYNFYNFDYLYSFYSIIFIISRTFLPTRKDYIR